MNDAGQVVDGSGNVIPSKGFPADGDWYADGRVLQDVKVCRATRALLFLVREAGAGHACRPRGAHGRRGALRR